MSSATAVAKPTALSNNGSGGRASTGRTVVLLAGRNARKIRRVPSIVTFSITMPLMMLFLMSQAFRAIADNPAFPAGVAYIDYLVPAILAMAVIMNASNSAVGIADDLSSGMLDRLRAMPVPGWTVLMARSLADAAVTIGQVTIVTGVAIVVLGLELHGSVGELAAMFALIVALGWAFSWLFQFIGVMVPSPAAAQMAGMTLMFPLLFVSSAFLPVETMPGWLRALAGVNPLSLTADAARGLLLGAPSGTDIMQALIAIGVVFAIGIVAASIGYRRVTS